MSVPVGLQLLAVGGGGALGALARWGVNRWFLERGWLGIPAATLVVNTAGCFLGGVLLVWIETRGQWSPLWRHLLLTGFLGAFTTFSALGVELWQFLRAGRFDLLFVAAGLHLVLGIAAVAAGYAMARAVWLAAP